MGRRGEASDESTKPRRHLRRQCYHGNRKAAQRHCGQAEVKCERALAPYRLRHTRAVTGAPRTNARQDGCMRWCVSFLLTPARRNSFRSSARRPSSTDSIESFEEEPSGSTRLMADKQTNAG